MDSVFEIFANNTMKTSRLARYLKSTTKRPIKQNKSPEANPYTEGHLICDTGYNAVLLGKEYLLNKWY